MWFIECPIKEIVIVLYKQLRLMKSELGVEEVVKERSMKVCTYVQLSIVISTDSNSPSFK